MSAYCVVIYQEGVCAVVVAIVMIVIVVVINVFT